MCSVCFSMSSCVHFCLFVSVIVFVCVSVSVRLSVSLSSIWILLILFSSSNPSFSLSSSHTLFALSSPPLLCFSPTSLPLPHPSPSPSPSACLIAAVCMARGAVSSARLWFTWQSLQINMLWWTDAWVLVRRSRTGGTTDWRGWALPWFQRQHGQQRAAPATCPDGPESSSRHCSSNAPAPSVLPRHGPQHHVTVEPEKIST